MVSDLGLSIRRCPEPWLNKYKYYACFGYKGNVNDESFFRQLDKHLEPLAYGTGEVSEILGSNSTNFYLRSDDSLYVRIMNTHGNPAEWAVDAEELGLDISEMNGIDGYYSVTMFRDGEYVDQSP